MLWVLIRIALPILMSINIIGFYRELTKTSTKFSVVSLLQHLKGLRLKYNSLSSEHFISLCPQLEKLTNITALDLSCNCINVYQNDSACDKLSHLLSQLPFLIRLDLSNNRIKSKVRRILSDIQKPLEYLRLVGCGLMIIDITYLSISHHAQGLRELDLSENSLKLSIPQVITLLKAARMNLKVLELEECDLTDGHFLSLSSSCLMELTGLMYLNISGNFLSLHVTESVVQSVATLSQLQWLIMAYMTGCYDVDNDEVEEQLKTRFREEVNDIMVNQRKSLNIEAMPSVLFKDLEQNMQ